MSLDINLTNVQAIPIVVNANITATNDSVYTVVANATFTDPTPVEGKGFKVFVRNGTAVVGGVSYSVIGSIIVRTFHSGAWSTVYYYDYITSNNLFQSRANLSTDVNTDQASNSKYPSVKAVYDWAVGLFVQKNSAITGATKTKITYDAKGLVTAGADATTADIADSSNKRYVTDANLTVLGNTSGVNTGDQTNITGNAATVTTNANLTGVVTSIGNATSIANGVITNAMLSNGAVTNLSGTNTGDQTFLTPRVQTVASSATVTPTSTNDLVKITAQAVGLTLANPTGTFAEGQSLIIRIKDDGLGARAITWDTNYRAIGVTLPATTVLGKTTYVGVIYNSDAAKWDVIGVTTEA